MGRWQPGGLTEGHLARQTTKRTVVRAKALRREMSLPEVLLWRELRQAEVKFRRQHPLGPYVLDFYCPAARLVVEVDGMAHDIGERPQRDELRAAFIAERGLRLVRIPAAEVLRSAADVAASLVRLASGED